MKPTQEFVDQILILRCQLRDRQAFAELIDRYQRPLRYFIARLVGNPDLADSCDAAILPIWVRAVGWRFALTDGNASRGLG